MDPFSSRREERWNARTHGVGFVLALAAFPFLILSAASRSDGFGVVGAVVFGSAMLLMLGASTAYHASIDPKRRRILQMIDHMSIYILIAGSYTPICMTTLRGPWGWSLLGIVWAMALTGILLKTRFTGRYNGLSTAIYLVMGWLCLIAVVPMVQLLRWETLTVLVFAGLSFTLGVFFYVHDRRSGFHLTWHIFVMLGCVGLYCAVFLEIHAVPRWVLATSSIPSAIAFISGPG